MHPCRSGSWKSWAWPVLAMLLGLCGAVWADTPHLTKDDPESPICILLVGDTRNPEMARLEQQTLASLKQYRHEAKLTEEQLPILVYDAARPRERQYCNRTLGVQARDLLWIGIALQQDRVVTRVVDGWPRVVDHKTAASSVWRHLFSPQISPTGLPTPPLPRASLPGIDYLGLLVTDGEGVYRTRFKTTDPSMFFHVLVTNTHVREEQQHSVFVRITDPGGQYSDAHLGGTFIWKAGEEWGARDVLEPTGYSGVQLNTRILRAGTWTVQVQLDGVTVDTVYIPIEPAQTLGDQLALIQAFVGGQDGSPASSFTTNDAGAFIFITLQNLAPDKEHRHDLRVQAIGPDGRVYHTFGGPLLVRKGEDLSHMELPCDVDGEDTNGLLIRGHDLAALPGSWKFVVLLDGQTIKDLPFTIAP